MPRFHFNVYDGVASPDDAGSDLTSVAEARVEAVMLFGSILREKAHEFWADQGMQLQVTDDSGLVLFTLSMSANVAPAAAAQKAAPE